MVTFSVLLKSLSNGQHARDKGIFNNNNISLD